MTNCKIENCNARSRKNGFCCRHFKFPSDVVISDKENLIEGDMYQFNGKMRKWDGKEFLFICDSCEYNVNNKRDLERHILNKHKNENDISWFVCDLCDYKAKMKKTLKNHYMYIHQKKEEGIWFYCDKCDYKSRVKHCLFKHQQNKHDINTEWFFCKNENCEFKTKNKYYLKNHVRRKHEINTKIFCCEKCDYKTKTKLELKNHNKRIHEENLVWFYCKDEKCDYKAKSDIEVKNHMKSKHISIEKKCNLCEYVTTDYDRLKQHVLYVHERNSDFFKCDICTYTCKYMSSLRDHILCYHSPEKPYFKCTIDDCLYKTKIKKDLKSHVKNFHDIGDKECNFCMCKCYKLINHEDKQGKHNICKLCFRMVTGYNNRIENVIVLYLKKNYKYPITSQDQIIKGEKCTKYRPDILYTSPNRVVIVEIDENQHKWNNGSYNCEEKRMLEIQEEFGGIQTIFIRFNPDKYKSYINKTISQRKKVLLKTLLELETRKIDTLMYVIYMFYDNDNPLIVKNIKHEFIM